MKQDKQTRVASLIFFSSDVEKERVLKWIAKLEAQGYVEGNVTKEYDPNYGEPCWYIP